MKAGVASLHTSRSVSDASSGFCYHAGTSTTVLSPGAYIRATVSIALAACTYVHVFRQCKLKYQPSYSNDI